MKVVLLSFFVYSFDFSLKLIFRLDLAGFYHSREKWKKKVMVICNSSARSWPVQSRKTQTMYWRVFFIASTKPPVSPTM